MRASMALFEYLFENEHVQFLSPVLNFEYSRNFFLRPSPAPDFPIPFTRAKLSPQFVHLLSHFCAFDHTTFAPCSAASLANLGRALDKFSSKELMSLVQQLQFSCSIKNANSLFYFECIPDPKSIWNNVFSVHIAWIYLQNTMQSIFC